jgi:hypothetical protein
MRPIMFILCATLEEAQRIATRENWDNWRWVDTPDLLRGTIAPHVRKTPCWFYGRAHQVDAMWKALRASEAVMVTIACTTHIRPTPVPNA